MTNPVGTTIGLSPRLEAALAYSGWWVTGTLVWLFEREDRFVRFHAAQAIAAFGLVALLVTAFLVLAAASLSFLPLAFSLFLWAAAGVWIVGMVLWLVVMWKAASGHVWRIPLAAELADRLLGIRD